MADALQDWDKEESGVWAGRACSVAKIAFEGNGDMM